MAKKKATKKSNSKNSKEDSRYTYGPGKSFGRGKAPEAYRRRRGF